MFFILALSMLLAGCSAVGPDYHSPQISVPEHWYQKASKETVQSEIDMTAWWFELNDPMLNQLIQTARANNLTLKQAVARIDQAEAQYQIIAGQRFPDIDLTGTATRDRASKNVFSVLAPPRERIDWFYSLGTALSWEIDFWGRVRRSVESAQANQEATIEHYRDIQVVLFAAVASTYINAITLNRRLEYANENEKLQKQTLNLTEERLKAEIAPELDVHQASANLANTQATIPSLKLALVQTINRLSILLGQYPGELFQRFSHTQSSLPSMQNLISPGLPIELLRQRPDIRRAERQLAGQSAQIGVAQAALYPSFQLLGKFSWDSFSGLGDIFDASSKAYQIGPSLRWNIWDAGRVKGNIELQKSNLKALEYAYQQVVLTAVEEVENALAAYRLEQQRKQALVHSVQSTIQAAKLVKELYISGLTNFQNVLDTQRSLTQQQDLLAQSEGQVLIHAVELYRALGGGWNHETIR